MSEDVKSPSVARATTNVARIGVLRLTDSAPAIVAHEFGFFADEGLDAKLSVEPSWANVADKLAHGALDAAVILPPLALAMALGLRGPTEPLIVPYCVSLGGNTITLRKDVATGLSRNAAGVVARLREIGAEATLGVVHDFSTHSLLLRYWLAAAGAIAERDYRLVVVPPARTVEALETARIVGFCAGAPWGEVARRAGAGSTVAHSDDVWQSAPEKCLAVRESFAAEAPDRMAGMLRALYRAAQFCDAPENSTYVAALLSRRRYVGVDSHAILSSLSGGPTGSNTSRFLKHAATFPWRSHALWFLAQMRRWGLISPDADLKAAARLYRPDLYAAALAPVGAPIPASDAKIEGEHREDWLLPASPAPIAMRADAFCDGALFDPASVA